MNKKDLVHRVAHDADLTLAQAAKAIESALDSMTESLAKGDDVRLVGFGTFKIRARRATKGRNPQTGESIDIPACYMPKFKAGKALKEAVGKIEMSEEDMAALMPPPKAGTPGWRGLFNR